MIHVSPGVHPQELFLGRRRRIEMAQQVGQPGGDKTVMDRR